MLGGSGCAPAAAPPPRIDITWSAPAGAAAATSARWVYAPKKPAGILGTHGQPDGSWLAWGRAGERWVVRGEGEAEAAGDLAPEDLIGLARAASGAWRFVGRSGALYEAASPLASFTRVLRAHGGAASVSASGSVIAVVGEGGALSWSRDAGESWRSVALDTRWIVDARVDGERAVVLGLPERLFVTTDGGSTFTRAIAPTVGAARLTGPQRGVITAVGYQRGVELGPSGAPRVVDAGEPVAPTPFVLPARAVADGADLARGRGFIWRGTIYVPITTRDKPGTPVSLGRGRIGERLEVTPLAGTERCAEVSLAGDERALYAACLVQQRASARGRVRVLRYTNTAEPPEELAGTLEGSAATRLALGPSDQLILWGACRRTEERCDVDTPLWLGQWETAAEGAEAVGSPWGAARAPALGGGVLDVKFAARGATAYLVGRRAKSGEIGLFISTDAGRTFEPRDLPLSVGASATGATISVGEPGVITIAVEGASPEVVLADEDGRVLSVGAPPLRSSAVRIGVAGRRALAVTSSEAWESSDAGVSWTSLGSVGALRCPDARSCTHPIGCSKEGCVVGAKVARVGWGAEISARQELDLDPSPGPARPSSATPPTLVCRLRKDKWIKLPAGASTPGASEAERGRTAFATFAVDRATAAVTMVHGTTAGKLEEVALLPKLPKGDGVALLAVPQVEGAAAIRFPIKEPAAKGEIPAGLAMRAEQDAVHPSAIEVAWENLFEGKLVRATLRPTPPASAAFGDAADPGATREARPELLSITSGGLFVRPGSGPSAELFFVDHAGRVERGDYAAWPSKTRLGEPLQINADAVRVGTTTVPFAIVRSAARTGSNTDRHAATGLLGRTGALAITPSRDGGFDTHTSFSYAAGSPLLVTETQLGATGEWEILTFPFRADGLVEDARPAPTQARAIEKPRPCSADDRAKTPRIVAPSEPGTRRAVLIEGPDGSRFAALVSSAMVLHGTRESPCQAALDATTPRGADTGDDAVRALVSLSEQTGWLFRGGRDVEARPMTCRAEPKAAVPQEVQRDLDGVVTPPSAQPPRRR